MASLALAFDVLARDRASKTFKDVGDSAEKAGKKGDEFGRRMDKGVKTGGRSLAGLGKGVGLAAAGLAGLAGAAAVGLGAAVKDARESERIGRMTAAVVKSTGGAAKITADQVSDLATAISNKTGADDEAIQSGANMLLTFTKVRNEVGKGNDIFNRATQAATDMAAAMGTDPKKAALQLGKALNDPVKGVTALAKSGVSFTAQQKDQIKAMVKAGDTLGAQKIILKEMQTQFGGAAAAASDPLTRLSVIAGNLSEDVGGLLLPVIGKFADWVSDKAVPAIKDFVGWMGPKLGPIIATASDAFGTIVTGFQGFFAALEEGDVTSDGFVGVMETIGDFLHRVLPPAIETVKTVITGSLIPAFSAAKDFITGTLIPAFIAVKDFIIREVLPRFLAIAETIRKFVEVAVPIVKAFVTGMIERIKPMIPTIQGIFKTIGEVITGAMDLIKAIIERVTGVIKFVWERWGQGIMDFIADIWKKILAIIGPAFEGIRSLFSTFTALFKGDWKGVWEGLKGTFSAAWKVVRGTIDLAMTALGKALSIVWSSIVTTAGRIWDGITGAISGPIDRAMQFIQENLIDKVNGLFEFLHLGLHIDPIWKASNVGSGMSKAGRLGTSRRLGAAAFASGGVLPGYTPGRDVHEFFSSSGGRLALSGGEAIMRPEFTRAMGGKRGIAALNRAARKGQAFADGGIFESLGNAASNIAGFVGDPVGSIKGLASRVLGGVGNNPMARLVAGLVGRGISGLVEKVKGLFGGGIPASATSLGGFRLDADTARRLQAAGGLRVIQGSWSHNPLSQGTHAGAGAVDLKASNWGAAVARLRAQGMLAMFRNWPGNQHIHALNPFVQGLSPQAQAQVRRARANGGIFADGGVVKPFVADAGVTLAPGYNLLHNKLGKPEPLQRVDQSGGVTIHEAHFHGVQDVPGMVRALQDYAARNGGLRIKMA